MKLRILLIVFIILIISSYYYLIYFKTIPEHDYYKFLTKDKILNGGTINPPTYKQLIYKLEKNRIPNNYLDINIPYSRKQNKSIFRIWLCKNKNNNCGGRRYEPEAINITNNIMKGWTQIVYKDNDVIQFLNTIFGKQHKITKIYHNINPIFGAARADLIRLLLIYVYGGIYLDIKSAIIKQIPNIPKNKDLWVSDWSFKHLNNPQSHLFYLSGEFQNWYIYGRQGSPLLKDIINRVVDNLYRMQDYPSKVYNIAWETNSKGIILSMTGPIALTLAVRYSIHNDKYYYDNKINKCLEFNYTGKKVGKKHYSYINEPLLIHQKNNILILKTIYVYDMPADKLKLIYNMFPKFKIITYNEFSAKQFIKSYFGNTLYNLFELSKYKQDIIKYLLIFLFGGYFITDIYTNIKSDIKNININNNYKKGYSYNNNHLLCSQPYNMFIYNIITHMYYNPKYYINNKILIDDNKVSNNWILYYNK